MFHAVVATSRAAKHLLRHEVRKAVDEQVAAEEELIVSPAWFMSLPNRTPRASSVRVLLTPGRDDNELTQFRYDVIVELDALTPPPPARRLLWGRDVSSLEQIRALLAWTNGGVLICNLPNKRLSPALRARRWVDGGDGPETLGEALSSPGQAGAGAGMLERGEPERDAIDPEDVVDLARAAGVHVEISWASADPDGRFDVLFGATGAPLHPPPNSQTRATGNTSLINAPLTRLEQRALIEALRDACAKALPSYMAPSKYVMLREFPLSNSGKIDLRRLPQVHGDRAGAPRKPVVSPRTPIEQQLTAIWCRVVGVEHIGPFDNFFEIGGHSLLATQVISEIRESFGVELPLRKIFEAPTVAELAAIVAAGARPASPGTNCL
jgi:acyl carrier protein